MKDFQILTKDNFNLSANIFEQQSDKVLLINSATAVPRQFYKRFASYASEHGYTVITFDYRGIGGSRPSSLRRFNAKMRDWGFVDIASILNWIHKELKPKQLHVIGHSVGGQVMGLIPEAESVDKMVTLSAQSGYWGVQGGSEKYRVWLIITVLMPLLSRLFGYFPWKSLGAGEDLPKGVALEWSRWCRSPKYLLDDESLPLKHYQNFTAPILAYSISDDDWGTKQAVDDMMSAYPNVQRMHISPADYSIDKLGHMGFFKPKSQVLWDEVLDWLNKG